MDAAFLPTWNHPGRDTRSASGKATRWLSIRSDITTRVALYSLPHTGKLHVTHRLRRPDLGHLETETIYEDPGTFKTPFRFKAVNVLATDEEVEAHAARIGHLSVAPRNDVDMCVCNGLAGGEAIVESDVKAVRFEVGEQALSNLTNHLPYSLLVGHGELVNAANVLARDDQSVASRHWIGIREGDRLFRFDQDAILDNEHKGQGSKSEG